MNFAAPPPENEQSNKAALMLSAAVHLLLLGALFFGVQWKSQAPSAVEVEVWRSVALPSPVTKPEPIPEPPKPEPPKPEPKPIPKVEPPAPIKPDIAIKDDKKPKKEEPKPPEPKREEPDWKKELARDQKQVDKLKVEQEMRNRAANEANQLAQLKAEQASAARNRGLADYASKVRGKVRGNIVLPPGIQGNPEAIFEVTQLPSGEVLGVKVRKSSGNKLLDDAIERAILKSSPLPKPDNPSLFDRSLRIPYKPFDE